MKITRLSFVAAGVAAAILVGPGCSKTPAPATEQKPLESSIEAIQNNPNMPPEAKQQAIDHIKDQQRRVVNQPKPE